MRSLTRLTGLCVAGAVVVALAVVALVPSLRFATSAQRYTPEKIHLPPLRQRSLLYDKNGKVLGTFQDQVNRSVVRLREVPKTVVDSVLAVEDADFFHHGPIDVKSLLRALRTNVSAGRAQQGGSTITQQVVKKSLTGSKRNLSRKLREAFLAVQLEKQMSKKRILERYLNIVYFGHGAYGVQAAAEVYFGKSVGQLGWAEGALLAALISNPNGYDPVAYPSRARHQRHLALLRLVKTGRLTRGEVRLYDKVPLPAQVHEPAPAILDYFPQAVLRRLLSPATPEGAALGTTQEARYNAVFRGGLRIHTTYDPKAQLQALNAIQQSIPSIGPDYRFPLPDYNGVPQQGTAAVTSIEPSTGAVRVLIGGPPVTEPDQLDIATDSLKQPGSSFKTFVLTAALEAGYVPNDLIDGTAGYLNVDDPITNQVLDPRYNRPQQCVNFSAGEGGVATLTQQTIHSVNCAFWRLGQVVGLTHVINTAKQMGLPNCVTLKSSTEIRDLPPAQQDQLANCLNPWYAVMAFGGTAGVHPFDMAAAYSVLANDGVRNPPYLVDKITDASGRVIYQHAPHPVRVISQQTARLVTQVLQANVQSGTGTRAQLPSGQPAAGKTGTTDEAKNLWFCGYTPQLATAVWVGDAGSAEVPIFGGGAQGGQYPAYTWGLFMQQYLAQSPIVDFPAPGPTRGGVLLQMGLNDGKPFDPGQFRPARPPADVGPAQPAPAPAPTETVPPATAAPGIDGGTTGGGEGGGGLGGGNGGGAGHGGGNGGGNGNGGGLGGGANH